MSNMLSVCAMCVCGIFVVACVNYISKRKKHPSAAVGSRIKNIVQTVLLCNMIVVSMVPPIPIGTLCIKHKSQKRHIHKWI